MVKSKLVLSQETLRKLSDEELRNQELRNGKRVFETSSTAVGHVCCVCS